MAAYSTCKKCGDVYDNSEPCPCEYALDDARDAICRRDAAIEKLKEQRDAYFSVASTITGDKDNNDDDEVIEKILKGEA